MFLPTKSLGYSGFNGQPCSCEYVIVPEDSLPGGRPGIIFIQRPDMTTSITNRIEIIASLLLKQDFLGVSPKSLRFFEHYPSQLRPLIDWQEVSFSEKTGCFLKNGLWSRVMQKLISAMPDYWTVDSPMWHPVGPNLKAHLYRLVYATSM